jgi:hypothetical protein
VSGHGWDGGGSGGVTSVSGFFPGQGRAGQFHRGQVRAMGKKVVCLLAGRLHRNR